VSSIIPTLLGRWGCASTADIVSFARIVQPVLAHLALAISAINASIANIVHFVRFAIPHAMRRPWLVVISVNLAVTSKCSGFLQRKPRKSRNPIWMCLTIALNKNLKERQVLATPTTKPGKIYEADVIVDVAF
jgi:hypothetical protein